MILEAARSWPVFIRTGNLCYLKNIVVSFLNYKLSYIPIQYTLQYNEHTLISKLLPVPVTAVAVENVMLNNKEA